jgi:hypothetical protein
LKCGDCQNAGLEMASLGEFLFWLATTIAGLIAALVLWEFVDDFQRGHPIIQYHTLLIAGVIWLLGWVSRQTFA